MEINTFLNKNVGSCLNKIDQSHFALNLLKIRGEFTNINPNGFLLILTHVPSRNCFKPELFYG